MRVDKILAHCGYGSRREAAALVRAGRASIGGQAVRSASEQADPALLCVDGRRVAFQAELYVMMNKPAGVLTAARDAHAPTVLDLLPPLYAKRGIAPVGRLDKDVRGLLILTTDGELNHRLTSPRWGAQKVYVAQVDGALTEADVAAFARGIRLKDFTARPAQLVVEAPDTARLTVHEGKYHQVKRMFAAIGKPVVTLRRLEMGGVALDPALSEGGWRDLTDGEIARLRAQVEEKHG